MQIIYCVVQSILKERSTLKFVGDPEIGTNENVMFAVFKKNLYTLL